MSAVKYTDRDVRENPEYYGIVVDFLVTYQGEFQFLIDCKMRVMQDHDLTVGMVRGVLNCMRVDPRAPTLPEPKPITAEDMEAFADVIPMREPLYRKPKKIERGYCTNQRPHQHTSEDWQTIHYCPGVLKVERPHSYRRPAEIHPEYVFVKAKSLSTTLIHRATSAEVEWYPKWNDYYWSRKPEVIVHTDCTYPHYLRNPLLATVEQIAGSYGYRRCMHCFPVPIDEIEED